MPGLAMLSPNRKMVLPETVNKRQALALPGVSALERYIQDPGLGQHPAHTKPSLAREYANSLTTSAKTMD